MSKNALFRSLVFQNVSQPSYKYDYIQSGGVKTRKNDLKLVDTGEKPKSRMSLIERYCSNNKILETDKIFDLESMPGRLHEQLFRNLVFASSMAELAHVAKWYVVNLRSQHVMYLKKGKPESLPVVRNVRSMLRSRHKKRFSHLTWEEIFEISVKGNDRLCDLSWYMKNKTINCQRAFNIL